MKTILISGGAGQLGRVLVDHFKTKESTVISLDIFENDKADKNIVIKSTLSWEDQVAQIDQELDGQRLDAVLCVAGGWSGGNLLSNNLLQGMEKNYVVSLQSSITAARIAAHSLKEGGLLVLTGSWGAYDASASSGMIGYALSKVAVHHLSKICAEKSSGMPKDSQTICLMPVCLDTEMNRKNMPKANFDDWTKLSEIAERISRWIDNKDLPKTNGALVKIETKENQTNWMEIE